MFTLEESAHLRRMLRVLEWTAVCIGLGLVGYIVLRLTGHTLHWLTAGVAGRVFGQCRGHFVNVLALTRHGASVLFKTHSFTPLLAR
jgi:hypothetical protein